MFDVRSSDGRHRGAGHPRAAVVGHVAVRVGRVVAALISLSLLVGFGYAWNTYRSFQTHSQTIAVSGLGHSSTQVDPALQHVVGNAQNLLIVGVDSRVGLSQQEKKKLHLGAETSSTSTDTIMVVHVPADGSKATLVSIPRDTYVEIPGFGMNKINAAYANGYYNTNAKTAKQAQSNGASLLVATVKKLTGVPIDHYIQVGFAGFEDIVKAIGTVPVTLCKTVSDWRSGFRMSAGRHDLTPTQALEFVRQRHNIPGPVSDDFGREMRQRYFLAAAFKQVLSANVLLSPSRLSSLLTAVDHSFITDGENFGVEKFAQQMADLSAGHITGASIPNTGSAFIDNQDVVTVNTAAVRAFVLKSFYGTPTTKTPTAAPTTGSSSSTPTSHGPTPASTGCVY